MSRYPGRQTMLAAAVGLAAVVIASDVRGQVFYSENFNDGLAATRWTLSGTGGTNVSDFAFDYTVSTTIPAAPRGGGLGLKLDPNVGPTGAISALMAFPNGQSFSGPHTLNFDLWLQWGPGGTGSTEFGLAGVNHTSTGIQLPTAGTGAAATSPPNVLAVGPSPNGIIYGLTGDNGASRDVRLYQNGTEIQGVPGGFIGSGTTPNLIQETGTWGYVQAYTGATPGNQWLQVSVTSVENRTIFEINGRVWADTTLTTPTSPGNIMLGSMDIFASVANPIAYALFDNVTVTVPEPSAVVSGIVGAVGLGGIGLRRRRSRSRRPVDDSTT